MKIPSDENISIDYYFFNDMPLEIGRWKDPESRQIQTVFRRPGGKWLFAKEGELGEILVKIHYVNRDLPFEEAWKLLRVYLEEEN